MEVLVHPCENQKQDWPALHSEVPLLHEQVYGSIVPLQCVRKVSEKQREGKAVCELLAWSLRLRGFVGR